MIKNLLNIKRKSKANVTTLFVGQMFLIMLITYCIFSFKAMMLNTMVAFLDDTIVDSLLSSALYNVGELGRSGQLIIGDEDDYDDIDWGNYEVAIQLSEMNVNQHDLFHESDLPKPKTEVYESASTGRNRTAYTSDSDKKNSVSQYIKSFNYNVSNGNYSTSSGVRNNIGTVTAATGGEMNIQKSVLDKYILGSYMRDAASNINNVPGTHAMDITRLDHYDIYKADVATRKRYKSYFFTLESSDDNSVYKSTYPTIKIKFKSVNTADLGTKSGANSTIKLNSLKNFDKAYKPDEDVEDYHKKYQIWKIYRKKFLQDIGDEDHVSDYGYGRSYYGYLNNALKELGISKSDLEAGRVVNRQDDLKYPLFCYINNHITYNGYYSVDNFNTDDVKSDLAKFFFNDAGSGTDDSALAFENDNYRPGTFKCGSTGGRKCTYRARAIKEKTYAPITGYSVYSYKSGYSEYNYPSGCTYKYYGINTPDSVLDSNGRPIKSGKIEYDSSSHRYTVKLEGDGRMAGYKLTNTSLYTEVTFNLTTFMIFTDKTLTFREAPLKRVTMARLVDLNVNKNRYVDY